MALIRMCMGGAKLLLMTTSVYPVDCACFCPLLKGRCNLSSASHPPTPLYIPFLIRDGPIPVSVSVSVSVLILAIIGSIGIGIGNLA